jgi:hypothetical protein
MLCPKMLIPDKASRFFSAAGRGKDGYQKQLLQSIIGIDTSSEKLRLQAQKLNISETNGGLKLIWDRASALCSPLLLLGAII